MCNAGRVGAVASSATKTFLSSSLSSDTSKQSASTAFKVPLSRSRSGAPGAFCQPLSLPEAPGELCRSNPSSPISHADRYTPWSAPASCMAACYKLLGMAFYGQIILAGHIAHRLMLPYTANAARCPPYHCQCYGPSTLGSGKSHAKGHNGRAKRERRASVHKDHFRCLRVIARWVASMTWARPCQLARGTDNC